MKTSNVAIGFIIFLVAIFVLPIYFKSLRYDLINHGGYGPSFSEDKEESKERGVYICDLVPVSTTHVGTHIEEAWVEKLWWRGSWYWTTKPDPARYYVNIRVDNSDQFRFNLSSEYNCIFDTSDTILSVGCLWDGRECGSDLPNLPISDTLICKLTWAEHYDHRSLDTKCAKVVFKLVRK